MFKTLREDIQTVFAKDPAARSVLEVIYDYKAMARMLSREKLAEGPLSMWRYRDMLPVEGKEVDIGAGAERRREGDTAGNRLGER